MSHWQRLLDLDGQCHWHTATSASSIRLPDDLQGPVLMITDYGSAPFGVDTLPAHSRRLAPLVEKHLRERGEIDGQAQVLVHDSEHQGGIARVCYTAVPVADYLRYRSFSQRHPEHLLLFPLADALLALARQQELNDGLLLFVHGVCVDVVMLQQGRIQAASRLRRFGDEPVEDMRLAIAIERLWQTSDTDGADLVMLEQTAGASSQLGEILAKKSFIKGKRPPLSPLDLFGALNLAKANQPPLERALYLGSLALPSVAMLMLLLSLLTAGLMVNWRADTRLLQEQAANAGISTNPQLRQHMTSALHHAEQLTSSQHALTDFVHLAERVSQIPDPATLIRHLRQATPNNIALTEASIVSSEEGGLIVVVGRSQSAAAPLDAEGNFVNALEQLGYRVVRREIEGSADSSLFRLALTWSES